MIRVVRPPEEEKEAIKQILLDLAEYYSQKLSDKQIDMYIEDLLEMGSDYVTIAVSRYRKDWNSKTFPLPSTLRRQVYFRQPALTETAYVG